MRKRKLNDERVIAALIAHSSVRAAAEACSVSEAAIYDRMKDEAFMKLYDRARDDLLRGCIGKLESQLSGAVDVIASVMNDEDVNPAVRVQAARQILEYSARIGERWKERETVIRQEDGPETMWDQLSRALYEEAVSRAEMQKFVEEATNL